MLYRLACVRNQVLLTLQITEKYQKERTTNKRNKLNTSNLPNQEVSIEQKIRQLNPKGLRKRGASPRRNISNTNQNKESQEK